MGGCRIWPDEWQEQWHSTGCGVLWVSRQTWCLGQSLLFSSAALLSACLSQTREILRVWQLYGNDRTCGKELGNCKLSAASLFALFIKLTFEAEVHSTTELGLGGSSLLTLLKHVCLEMACSIWCGSFLKFEVLADGSLGLRRTCDGSKQTLNLCIWALTQKFSASVLSSLKLKHPTISPITWAKSELLEVCPGKLSLDYKALTRCAKFVFVVSPCFMVLM